MSDRILDDEFDPWEQEQPDDYRPLDFDDNSFYDRRLEPSMEDILNEELDVIQEKEEREAAKDEKDKEEDRLALLVDPDGIEETGE